MTPEAVTARIQAAFPGATVEVTGEDCSFSVVVVSSSFARRSPLERQRAVLSLFTSELASGALHALTVKATDRLEAIPTRRDLVGIVIH